MLRVGGWPVAEPLQDGRDQCQDDEAADQKKDVRLEEGGAVGRAAARLESQVWPVKGTGVGRVVAARQDFEGVFFAHATIGVPLC
jgi:hypothetical protein